MLRLIRSILLLSMLMAYTAMMMPDVRAATIKIGDAAPEFSLLGSDEKAHSLSEYAGKIVVLEWFNYDCPFVRKQYDDGHMQALQKKYTEQGVVWFSVISSAPGKQGHVNPKEARENTLKDKAKPTAVLLDPKGDVGRSYHATNTPHVFIVDQSGEIAYLGAIDDMKESNNRDIDKATNFVDLALTEMLAGTPLSRPVTSPYGCSIKY